MVPTIFPPSTVNRGESIHVRPPEPERRPRPPSLASLSVQESLRFPKKRGRKPKLHLHYEKQEASSQPAPHSLSKMPRRLHHHGDTADHSLIQLTKRFQEETTITPKSCSEHAGAAGLSCTCACAFSPDARKSAQEGHRTYCSGPQPSKLRHSGEPRRHQEKELFPLRERAAVVSSQSESIHETATRPASCWVPNLTNLDSVTVTDVTMNLLTVTIKESSTDKGFFKDKR